MKFSGYAAGAAGLAKDFGRFALGLLRRPHYVAVLLALVVGAFWLGGVKPTDIPRTVELKWQAFVANRKQVVTEELQSLSERMNNPDNPLKAVVFTGRRPAAENKQPQKQQAQAQPQTKTEPVSEQRPVFLPQAEARREIEQRVVWKRPDKNAPSDTAADGGAVTGTLVVTGADTVRIGGRDFSLRVRLRAGKATASFQQLKRRFDGRQGKCVPDENVANLAECFVGSLGLSETLIDFGYADPV